MVPPPPQRPRPGQAAPTPAAPPANVPAVAPVYRLRFRLVDDRSLHDPSHTNRFAGLFFRLFWGGTSDQDAEVWEGEVGPNGEIARDVDGSRDWGFLDVGVQHAGAFTAHFTVPLQRSDPPRGASADSRERKELFRRLYNLGYAIAADVPGVVAALESTEEFEEAGLPRRAYTDAIDRFVFRHHQTAPAADRDRYGPYLDAGQELLGGRRAAEWQRLVDDVRQLHDGR